MSTLKLFGPATVTHGGTDLGKTTGGGSITILEKSYEPLSSSYEVVTTPYGVEGQLNKFQFSQSLTISSSMELYSYGQIVITLKEGTITLYHAKIILPKSMSFGEFSQEPFTVRIQGGVDASGNLIKIN